MTLAQDDQIEMPMLITYEDCEALLNKCLAVLATHHHEWAKYTIDEYCSGRSKEDPERRDDSDNAGEEWKNR